MIDKETAEKIKTGVKLRVFDATGRFEGVVLARKHGTEAGATFTVRGVVADVGVEKIYPIQTPTIKKVEIISAPKKVRRAKIYYLRKLSKRKARRKVGVTA